jgi:DNA polymerase-3 subunit delta'
MNNSIYPWLEEPWKALQSKRARMPHALLIHGPQGVGKLLLAEYFAQSVLCESAGADGAPCGVCPGCRWFAAGSHPDFRRVEPEALARQPAADDAEEPTPARTAKPSQEIKVDQVRALDNFLNLKSHRGGPRLALIHPAEAMNPNAANALLKGLEEPPGRAQFILVSHRPARLLPTSRSRCVAVPVAVPEPEVALAWLTAQGVRDPGSWLAYASGSPLQALYYAQEASAPLEAGRRALAAGDLDTLGRANSREELEALAELLQKHALDQAFAAYCGRAKYGMAAAGTSGAAWLRYARWMGRNRALARHPLNPRLFAYEMLASIPRK